MHMMDVYVGTDIQFIQKRNDIAAGKVKKLL